MRVRKQSGLRPALVTLVPASVSLSLPNRSELSYLFARKVPALVGTNLQLFLSLSMRFPEEIPVSQRPLFQWSEANGRGTMSLEGPYFCQDHCHLISDGGGYL